MIRYIPRKTKVKTELLPHVTITDVIVGAICAVILLLVFTSNLPYKWIIGLSLLSLMIVLFLPLADGERAYYTLILIFRFFAFKKKYTQDAGGHSIKELIPYTSIVDDKYLDYGNYYGMVLQVIPVEFFLLTEDKQDAYIRSFKNALTRLNADQDCELVKINKEGLYDDFIRLGGDSLIAVKLLSYLGDYNISAADVLSLRTPYAIANNVTFFIFINVTNSLLPSWPPPNVSQHRPDHS